MTDARRFPDPERAVVVLLDDLTPSPATVESAVPEAWTKEHPLHLQVGWDGTLITQSRLLARATIRITSWHEAPTASKAGALDAHARLLAHDGSGPIRSFRPLAGPIPTRDPKTGAELTWFTVAATVRSTPLT